VSSSNCGGPFFQLVVAVLASIVLENMLASLRPGGACLIEVLGKEYLAKIFQPTTSIVLPEGTEATGGGVQWIPCP
jgi:hypothetical protein